MRDVELTPQQHKTSEGLSLESGDETVHDGQWSRRDIAVETVTGQKQADTGIKHSPEQQAAKDE